jgi:ring-1,2-phenylacetyl-CoA epoxidase subunit PaaD
VVSPVASVVARTDLAAIARIAADVEDPELPDLTLGDLGIFRGVTTGEGGEIVVDLTPTYSGCPAVEVITGDVRKALAAAGFDDVKVRMQLAPAWTTDWISAVGRQKLADLGIAPPPPAGAGRSTAMTFTVKCPRCGSRETEMLSRFSGTACKALHRCKACQEPFEAVKPL